jgi:hypothetical protein
MTKLNLLIFFRKIVATYSEYSNSPHRVTEQNVELMKVRRRINLHLHLAVLLVLSGLFIMTEKKVTTHLSTTGTRVHHHQLVTYVVTSPLERYSIFF